MLFYPLNSNAVDYTAVDYTRLKDTNLANCIKEIAAKQQWAAADQFTKIQCHNKGIESDVGLGQFKNLTKLSLYKNKIGSFTTSNLAKLKHLNIAKNRLTEANIENFQQLKELYLFNNKLTELTLTDLPELIKLKANSNKLLQFTTRNVGKLEKVFLFDNELEFVEIKDLPGMIYMDARHNPMPDEFYDFLDEQTGLTVLHDGNSEDWD